MSNRENDLRENSQNRTKEGESSGSFLAGAVIGGLVGAAAALLLAPKAGKELRSDLNNQVSNLLTKTTQLSDEALDKGNELASITKEKTVSISKAVVQQSKELVNKAKNLSLETSEGEEENKTSYISLKNFVKKKNDKKNIEQSSTNEVDIKKKLEEAQKAFEEEENKIKS
jgi:gas vesicle protein